MQSDDFLNGPELCCPLVAILSTNGANELASRNGLNFGDLLLPFACAEITIKDPLGQSVTHKLRLDLRDIRRKGFLLENTVFRFVLQESILEHCAETGYKYDGQSILSKAFYSTFLHWLEPAEHEFLRAYIGCIFVVSASESDPVKSFEELDAEQRQEQHGIDGKRMSPAYCAVPKWFFHQTSFKYYVLVQDNAKASDEQRLRNKQLFDSLCSRFGHQNCHLLCINSTDSAKAAADVMPDLWSPILAKNNRGLADGIAKAKKNLIANSSPPSKTLPNSNKSNGPATTAASVVFPPPTVSSPLHPQGISSTSSSQLFTASLQQAQSALFPPNNPNNSCNQQSTAYSHQFNDLNGEFARNQPPFSYAQIVEGTTSPSSPSPTTVSVLSTYGQCLDVEDRQRLRNFMEEMVTKSLVPFVERQLSDLNEIVANRKSLAKSTFSNMRKWLGATANAVSTLNPAEQQQQQTASASYPPESIGAQMRRMADLAFLFGLYAFSYQIYQQLKKEFGNDQAWLHHAGALEMAALSSFLNDWRQFSDQPDSSPSKALSALRKQYPQRYVDNAIHYYANVCRMPMLALRTLMNSSKVLVRLELFEDAARQMINVGLSLRLNSELFDAILLEHAARLYALANNRRRKVSFYLATAAIRISSFFAKLRAASLQESDDSSTPAATSDEQKSSAGDQKVNLVRKNLLRNLYEEVLRTSTIANNGWRWANDYLLYLYMDCF